jgi:hypothetical protein
VGLSFDEFMMDKIRIWAMEGCKNRKQKSWPDVTSEDSTWFKTNTGPETMESGAPFLFGDI